MATEGKELKEIKIWKIEDSTWKGVVGVMGSGVIVLLIMMVNHIIIMILGASEDEGDE